MAKRYVLSENSMRKLRTLLGGSGASLLNGADVTNVVDVKDYPAPWTLQWSETEESWLIYIPDQAAIVYLNGNLVYIDPPGDQSTSLGSCWYKVPQIGDENETLVLKINVDEEGEFVDNEWTNEYDGPYDDGFGVIIAIVDHDDQSGERYVWQICESAIFLGGSGGGGGTVATDNLSIDKSSNKLELLTFQTARPEADTVAKSMVQQSSASQEYVERGVNARAQKQVKYRKQGYFYAGANTNVTFTPDANGNVAIQVFYV